MYQAPKILPRVIITYRACARGGPGFEASLSQVRKARRFTDVMHSFSELVVQSNEGFEEPANVGVPSGDRAYDASLRFAIDKTAEHRQQAL